jgi:hypothetical protein
MGGSDESGRGEQAPTEDLIGKLKVDAEQRPLFSLQKPAPAKKETEIMVISSLNYIPGPGTRIDLYSSSKLL